MYIFGEFGQIRLNRLIDHSIHSWWQTDPFFNDMAHFQRIYLLNVYSSQNPALAWSEIPFTLVIRRFQFGFFPFGIGLEILTKFFALSNRIKMACSLQSDLQLSIHLTLDRHVWSHRVLSDGKTNYHRCSSR